MRASPITFFDENGKIMVKPGERQEAIQQLPASKPASERLNAQGEDTTTWEREFKLHDNLKAAELLCRRVGLVCADLPPLEALLNRHPPNVTATVRQLLASPGRPISQSFGRSFDMPS